MQSNSAPKIAFQPPDIDRAAPDALNNWRECVLRFLRDKMSELNEELQAAADGLGIAWRNQGEVAADVISTLSDKLEDGSTLLLRLARTSDRIGEMNFCELITLFSRTAKVQNYPWEGDAWQLPSNF